MPLKKDADEMTIGDIEKNSKDVVVLDFVNQMIKVHELKKNKQ